MSRSLYKVEWVNCIFIDYVIAFDYNEAEELVLESGIKDANRCDDEILSISRVAKEPNYQDEECIHNKILINEVI